MSRLCLFGTLLLTGTALAADGSVGTQHRLSVLIVDGMNNHDWPRATKILTAVLADSGLFTVNVSTSPPKNAPKKAWNAWRRNVPTKMQVSARRDLAGYYAHCTAIDDMVGNLLKTLEATGMEPDTIVVSTSDHGDMLGSHNQYKKQRPYEESIRVPLLIRYPAVLGKNGRKLEARINTEDLMPTLLGLCGVKIPESVEGLDFSAHIRGGECPGDGAVVITCPQPFGQFLRRNGGREYRGIRTARYTYVRDLNGPWLLFDNEQDPHQMRNLCNQPVYAELQTRLDSQLRKKLKEHGDEFLPVPVYLERWGYKVDADGTVPYRN